MTFLGQESATLRYLLYVALLVIIVMGIHMAAWFVNIVIMAVILAMLAYPVVNYLKKKDFRILLQSPSSPLSGACLSSHWSGSSLSPLRFSYRIFLFIRQNLTRDLQGLYR